MAATQIDRYVDRIGDFDRLRLEYGKGKNRQQVGKGSNNSDTGVSATMDHKRIALVPATMDHKWIDRYFKSLSLRVGLGKQLKYPRSQINEQSMDLEVSLKLFSQEASCVADNWTDVNRKYDDKRSFGRFLRLLKISGLDNYAFKDNNISISNQPSRRLPPQTLPDMVFADKYHSRSLSLIQLLRRIQSESRDDFRREQAKLLESLLDHLIKIQEEQGLVAYNFSENLQQLRKFSAISFSSNVVVDDDGDRHKGYDILFEHRMQKESLDQNLLEHILYGLDRNLLEDILYDFGERIKRLQMQCFERRSVAEMLLGCFLDVVKMLYKPRKLCLVDMLYALRTHSSRLGAFYEAANDISEMIYETLEKFRSVGIVDLANGGCPLGSIVLWRIRFESTLINLRLDLLYKKLRETVKFGVELLDTATNAQRDEINFRLDQIRMLIDQLLECGSSVLAEFVAMQKTVAEVTYTLGDAFTTGGAGMRGPSDVTPPASSFNVDDLSE